VKGVDRVTMEASARWQGGLSFRARTGSGHELQMGSRARADGLREGPAPKEVLLAALAACTGMDVAAILERMRQPVEDLVVEAEGEVVDKHPLVFRSIRLRYRLTGSVVPEQFLRAVQLSQERYCPISAMLRGHVAIEAELSLNGQPLGAAPVASS
jgi:putative redox protein